MATAKTCPNMWETTSGGAVSGDTPITGVIRELDEELGIKVNKDDLKYMGTYARVNDYVEVFLLKSNIKIFELKLQYDEVQDVKWMKISEFEELVDAGMASDTGYSIFKQYYENYYNRYLTFVDGKPVFRKIGE